MKTNSTTLNIRLRPRSFKDVIGLDREILAVQTLINSGNLPRAFLLAGQFGCGKTTLAYLIARSVQGGEGGNEADSKFWLREVNAASVTGIDAMRELIDSSQQFPLIGKHNVIILDEAHKLSKPAQEALLKTFESESSPTIWIICTTDKDKLAEGIRAGRCFTLKVRGLEDPLDRATLVARAAEAVKFEGDVDEFLAALTRGNVTSPRKILMAFDAFYVGIPAVEAIGSMHVETLPEYWEICMGVVFGDWGKPYTLSWIKDKEFPAVCEQLFQLEARLKRKSSAEVPQTALEDDDVQGRPEVAQALRCITAATLKGQLIRQSKRFAGERAVKAAEALLILSEPTVFGAEFPLAIGVLFRANKAMK